MDCLQELLQDGHLGVFILGERQAKEGPAEKATT